MVEILKDLHLLKKINSLFIPICRILKVSKSNSILTLVSTIIGLSYGYGVLKEAQTSNIFFKKEQAFNVITFLSIMHAIIEDNMIFIILGASFWVVLVFRFIYAMIITYVMHKYILPKLSSQFKHKYLYKIN